jgi:hypothetical protein
MSKKPKPRNLTVTEARQLDRLGYKIVGLKVKKPRRRGGRITLVLTVARPE